MRAAWAVAEVKAVDATPLDSDVRNARPTESELSLHAAAAAGDIRRLRALLEAGVTVDAPDGRHRSALMIAAEQGRIEAMLELVRAGAELDARDTGKRRWTPLMYALHADRSAAAEALLDWGADARARDDVGYSALMMAASRGDERLVRELLRRGADALCRTFLGFTALDYAIGYGHAGVARLLLDAAPRLRERNNAARRAVLELAANAGNDEVLELLR